MKTLLGGVGKLVRQPVDQLRGAGSFYGAEEGTVVGRVGSSPRRCDIYDFYLSQFRRGFYSTEYYGTAKRQTDPTRTKWSGQGLPPRIPQQPHTFSVIPPLPFVPHNDAPGNRFATIGVPLLP